MSITTRVAMMAALLAVPIFAVAQTEWVEYPGNPVIQPPVPGDWDAQRYLGAVIEVDGTYHMYFNGRAGGGGVLYFEIGHATSSDGVTWVMDPANPVMTLGDPGQWDDGTLWVGAVIHDGSGFRMWYGGNDGQFARAGYATSPDGFVWAKYPGNPVMDVGPPGSFDEQWVLPDTVIVRAGHYQMWYWAAGSGVWRTGHAESDDGLSWAKNPWPVIDSGWGSEVLFDGLFYGMWYAVGSEAWAAIFYAVSPDGIAWTPCSSNPVVGVYSALPAVLYDSEDSVYEMWYQGPGYSIRLATSECCATVFFDGFESGDTSAWSAMVP